MSTISIERPSQPLAEVADGELVRKHLAGRDEAFEVLYRRHHDRLVGWFVRRTGDRVLAEDLAQDTMVRVLKYGDSFDQDRPMWPWLKTTAYRVMVNHLEDAPDRDESFEDQYEDEGEPDPLLSSIEERPALERVLGQLSERHQTALSLRYVRGWSPDDVADFFGVTRNACNQLMHRARHAARREYDRVCGETRAIVAPIFGGAFARMRALGGRLRQTVEALGLGSATAAVEAFAHLAIGLALTAVGASGALAATSSPDISIASVDLPLMELASLEAEAGAAPESSHPNVKSAPVPEDRVRRTADSTSAPGRVNVETSLDTELPASMGANAGADSGDKATVTTRAFAYVPTHEEEDPLVARTGLEIYCDPSSPVVNGTACAALDVVEEVIPPPE